jgi:hypothetical protein
MDTFKATTIFVHLLDFAQIVQQAKETCERKARSMKRKAKMNTPIKVSRPSSTKKVVSSKKSIDAAISSVIKGKSVTPRASSLSSNDDDEGQIIW